MVFFFLPPSSLLELVQGKKRNVKNVIWCGVVSSFYLVFFSEKSMYKLIWYYIYYINLKTLYGCSGSYRFVGHCWDVKPNWMHISLEYMWHSCIMYKSKIPTHTHFIKNIFLVWSCGVAEWSIKSRCKNTIKMMWWCWSKTRAQEQWPPTLMHTDTA